MAGRDVSGDSGGTGNLLFFSLAIKNNSLYGVKQANGTACSQTPGSAIGCELMIFDISSSTNPVYVAGRDASGSSASTSAISISTLTALDNFLYVGKANSATACSQVPGSAIGCELMVFSGSRLSGTMVENSAWNNISVNGPKIFMNNASTSDLTIESDVSITAPQQLSVSGDYSNSGRFIAESGTTTFNGTSAQIATGTMTASSSFYNLVIANTSGAGSSSQSVLFGSPISATGTFTMEASTSVQLLAGATSTFNHINLSGASDQHVWLRSTVGGTPAIIGVDGTQEAVLYVNVRDSNACAGTTIDADDGTSYDAGNNTCWSFSAVLDTLVLSGALYIDEGTTQYTNGETITIAIGTSTLSVHSTTTDTGAGTWAIVLDDAQTVGTSTPILVYVDGDTTLRAVHFTKASSTNDISNLNLYKDRVIISHEGTSGTSTTITDMSFYDNDDDTDVQYNAATSSTGDTLTVQKGNELYIKADKHFAPGGAVTVNANASASSTDGSLRLTANSTYTQTATTTIGGSFTASSSATYTALGPLIMTSTSSSQKLITATSSALSSITFSGAAGAWTFDTNAATTTGTLTIATGTVTAPASTLTIGGNLAFQGGSFIHNAGTVYLNGSTAQYLGYTAPHRYWRIKNLTIPAADYLEISELQFFEGGTNVTSGATKTASDAVFGGNFTNLFDGSLSTAPYWTDATAESATFWIKADFGAGSARRIDGIKQGGLDNSSRYISAFTLEYSDDDTTWVSAGTQAGLSYPGNNTLSSVYTLGAEFVDTSTLNNVVFSGAGEKAFSVRASTTNLTIAASSATVTAPIYLTVGGDFTQNGLFAAGSSTLYLASTSPQTLSGTLVGLSTLGSTRFQGSGTKTFSSNASTSHFIIESGSGAVSPPSSLSISGNFANSGTFTAGSGNVYISGTSSQTLSGTMTDTSAFNTLSFLNGGAKTFSNNASTSDFMIGTTTGNVTFPTMLTIGGNLNNAAVFDHNAGAVVFSSASPQSLSGFMTPTAPHRYWRIKNLTVPGTDLLEISEIQFLEGGSDVTSGATKTSSDAPTGSLANLFDGSLSTAPYWTDATAESATFWIKADFGAGSARRIDGIKQGGLDNSSRYISAFTLEYSDDDTTWVSAGTKAGLSYPGNNTLSSEYSFALLNTLNHVSFLGSGTKTFGSNASTTNFTVSAGTVVAPNSLTVAGNFTQSGTYTAGRNLYFSSTTNQTISGTLTDTSALGNVTLLGATTKTFANNASTTNLTIGTGATMVAATSTTVGGDFTQSGTYTAGSNLYFSSTTNQTISGTLNSISLGNVTLLGVSTKTLSNNASTTNLTINSGATMAAPTLLTIGGNFTQNGIYTAGQKLYLSSTSAQTLSGTLVDTSALGTTTFMGSSTKTISSNASTTGFIVGTTTTVIFPTSLSIAGHYTNSGTTTAGSGTTTFSGTSIQTATGTMTGSSTFNNLRITNTSGAGSSSQSVIFGSPLSATGTFTMLASTSAQFPENATSTFKNINFQGTNGSPVWLRSSTADTKWGMYVPEAQVSVAYVNVKDNNASSSEGLIDGTSSIDSGNNTGWDFGSPATTTLGSASTSDPLSLIVGPGTTATTVNMFSFVTSEGTDTITSVTLSHQNASSASLIEITSADGAVVYGSTSAAVGTSTTITLATSITATTGPTMYKVRMTPKAHANLPTGIYSAPISFRVAVLSWTGTNVATGTDTALPVIVENNTLPAIGITATSSFAARVSYNSGSGIFSIDTGDVNNDSYIDLLAAESGPDTVSVFLNNGDGTFAAGVSYTTGLEPYSVSVGDVNNDGYVDMAVVNQGVDSVTVFLNDGDGTFDSASSTYRTNSGPRSVVIDDFTSDGYADFAVMSINTDSVSVYVNDGDGTFDTASSTYPTGSTPLFVTSGDLDNDGYADIVTGNNNNVSVLLNDGDGTFAPNTDYTSGVQPYGVAVGDVNNDGYADLASSNYSSDSFSVLINDGDGTFAPRVDYQTFSGPRAIAVGDVDNDGFADLAVANSLSTSVSVVLNDGDGTFNNASSTYTTISGPSAVSVSDFDNDGFLDVATGDYGGSKVSVFIGNSTTTLSVSAGIGEATISYTTPPFDDLDSIVVLRGTSAVTDAPVDGTTYTGGETVGAATVACVDATVSTSTADSCIATGLSGVPYYFKVFVKDSYGNYSYGVEPLNSPVTPSPLEPYISSALNQLFTIYGATTSIATLTITDNETAPSITAANDIRIAIGTSTTNMKWDAQDTTATFGGTASGKVSNPVSYERDNTVLVIPVDTNFDPGDTLTISGLSFGNFTAVSPASTSLGIRTAGAGVTTTATDDKTIAITGSMTLDNHSGGQVTDNFLFPSDTNVPLFAFNLTPAYENAAIASMSFSLEGVNGITSSDLTNIALYQDHDGDKVVDATDTRISTATLSIGGQTGTITLTPTYSATTSTNYLLAATTTNIRPGDHLTVKLISSNITTLGSTSYATITPSGTVSYIQHMKGGIGTAGTPIGGDFPAAVTTTGGDETGGDSINPDEGDSLSDGPGYRTPASHGTPQSQWNGGGNAYTSDGTYATTSTNGHRHSYGSFTVNVPGNQQIIGIEVKLEASASTNAGTIDVALSYDGGGSLTTPKTTTTLTTSDAVYTLGSSIDTWGRTWTTTETNNTNLQVEVIANTSANTINLDTLRVIVHTQTTGGGGGGGGMVLVPTQQYFAGALLTELSPQQLLAMIHDTLIGLRDQLADQGP